MRVHLDSMRGGVGDEGVGGEGGGGHAHERYQSTYICGERDYLEGGDGNRFQREGEKTEALARVCLFSKNKNLVFVCREATETLFRGGREMFSRGCMYVCVCRYVYICMYVCMYACMCMCMYTYKYVCVYVRVYVYTHTHIHTHIDIYLYTYIHIYLLIYIYLYIIYIFIQDERRRQRAEAEIERILSVCAMRQAGAAGELSQTSSI